MDADGANPRRLTDNPARDESPGLAGAAVRRPRPPRVRRRLARLGRRVERGRDAGPVPRRPCASRGAGARPPTRARPQRDPRPGRAPRRAALRPDGRAMRRRRKAPARATSPSSGATRRAHPRRPPPSSPSRLPKPGRRRGGPRRRGLRRGPRRLTRTARGTRGAAVTAAPRRRLRSAARLVERVLVLGEVVLGERREAGADLLRRRLAGQRVVGLLHAVRRRSRPASGR